MASREASWEIDSKASFPQAPYDSTTNGTQSSYCLRFPKTSNTDVHNQGRGTISDVSLLHTTGSFITFLNAIEARSPSASLISLWCWMTSPPPPPHPSPPPPPPFLQSRACSRLNAAPHSSQVAGILSKGRWYLIASASLNSVADKSKWCVHSGNTASHAEVLPSIERRNALFFFESKIERIESCVAWS